MNTTTPSKGVAMRDALEQTRVLVVAGITTGVVVVGGGSRLAMFVLRLTSPDQVRGVINDDGFVIGRVTLAGTYNLLNLGAAVGVIGAGVYRLVGPWLIGPSWLRRVTTGAAAAAVAGSLLLHADGVDFTVLKPRWLAIGLFVALPGLFAAAIGVGVDRMARPTEWAAHGHRRWLVPLLLVLPFPLTIPPVAVTAAVVTVCVGARHIVQLQRVRTSTSYGLVVRAVWFTIAIAGLIAVVHDVRDII